MIPCLLVSIFTDLYILQVSLFEGRLWPTFLVGGCACFEHALVTRKRELAIRGCDAHISRNDNRRLGL